MTHFSDVLLERIERAGAPVCVGFDPVFERLPEDVRRGVGPSEQEGRLEAIRRFADGLFDVVAADVPCVKVQSACFERYGSAGVAAYEDVLEAARGRGLLVIGDVKRGDIGTSAAHYAAGLLGGGRGADALTVSAYFGDDGLRPFCDRAAEAGGGVFALVRTSNPGGDAIQALPLADGRTVAAAVAQQVAALGAEASWTGARGYSLLGAVVGATKPADAARLRTVMERQIFLVPGFGAQGGGVEGVRACFREDGTGALVTASRSVIYAHEASGRGDWRRAVRTAVADMADRVNAARRA